MANAPDSTECLAARLAQLERQNAGLESENAELRAADDRTGVLLGAGTEILRSSTETLKSADRLLKTIAEERDLYELKLKALMLVMGGAASAHTCRREGAQEPGGRTLSRLVLKCNT